MKTRWKILIGVVVVALPTYFFLVKSNTTPSDCQFALDLPQLRALAASLPGERAVQVRVEHIATFRMPGAVVVTGEPWAMTEMPVYAYQIAFPSRAIIIDTAMSPDDAKKAHAGDINEVAWGRLKAALSTASSIYVTHEHADHMGGLVAAIDAPNVLAAAHLTKEQLDHPDRLKPVVLPEAARAGLHPLSYEGAVAVAPGVVLIKAPGHTPGSQLVFVQLADGKELLLLGDTAWHHENVDEVRGPPHLTSLLLHNDRQANICQLAAIHELGVKNPALYIVPGHDGSVMQKLIADGVVTSTFKD